jgi:hypothetical protein
MRTNPEASIDTIGGLGSPIRPDKPAPAPVPVSPGIVRNPDGTLATNAPPPPPTWVYTPPAAAPTAVPAPVVSDGQEADWEGLCYGAAPGPVFRYKRLNIPPDCVITYALSDEERKACAEAAEFLLKHGAP